MWGLTQANVKEECSKHRCWKGYSEGLAVLYGSGNLMPKLLICITTANSCSCKYIDSIIEFLWQLPVASFKLYSKLELFDNKITLIIYIIIIHIR